MVGKKISAIKKLTVKQIGKVLLHKKQSQFSGKAWGASRISLEPEIKYTNSGYAINLHCFMAILKIKKKKKRLCKSLLRLRRCQHFYLKASSCLPIKEEKLSSLMPPPASRQTFPLNQPCAAENYLLLIFSNILSFHNSDSFTQSCSNLSSGCTTATSKIVGEKAVENMTKKFSVFQFVWYLH